MRRFLNNYQASITTATVLDTDLALDIDIAPPALSAGEYYILTLTDNLTAPTKIEIVKATAVAGSTLTIERAQEGTAAQGWAAGDTVHLADTAGAFETLDGPDINDYAESTLVSTSGDVIQSSGQLLWDRTLTANTTFTSGLTEGQGAVVHLRGTDVYTPTWPAGVSWIGGSAPTLTGADELVFYVLGGQLFGKYGGVI